MDADELITMHKELGDSSWSAKKSHLTPAAERQKEEKSAWTR